jgi:OOP family OmpA-OmpF porin
MNATQVVASGIVAAAIGLAPTIAAAQGFYMTAFGGFASADIDEPAYDLSYVPVLQSRGQLVFTDGTDNIFYDVTASNYVSGGGFDDSSVGWGLNVGYEFNPYVALEVGYVDLGKYRQEGGSLLANYSTTATPLPPAFPAAFAVPADVSARIISSGPTLAVAGKFPFGPGFSVYGRAGVYFADTRVRLKYMGTAAAFDPDELIEVPVEFKAATQEIFAGIGAGWDFSEEFGLRFDAQYFLNVGDEDRTGETDVLLITLGIAFR